ncbi:MAG: PQQ-dependent sugar dehydrogenase [Prolixibacteraceae bacterium]|nr:PQQ-dependent sugar dehydrogenase [Prolixibacteraceae bacterium]
MYIKNLFNISTIIILVPAFLSFYSCNHSKADSSLDANPNTVKNYENYCAGCHGFQLEKFEKKEWMYGSNDDDLIESIVEGRPEMGMPGFKKTFTEEEVVALAEYIKEGIPDDLKENPGTQNNIHNTDELTYRVDTIVSGLEVPWGMEFLPNGDILISERSGTLYRFSDDKLYKISGLPEIFVKGQGGLMDIKLHPDYENNGWIYFSFSAPADEKNEEGGNTSIMRTRLKNDLLYDTEIIFNGEPDTNKSYHFGCKLAFDNDDYLFFGIGDRGHREFNPQTLTNHNGKIHRIHDDGSIPEDNPFVDNPEAMPSIYSYGHRNPQGTDIHPETNEVWISEHGPKGGDELNLIKPGLNYGWPVISYGINYDGTTFTDITHKEGMEQPVIHWTPSIAPCGMIFVRGDKYPGWENNILVGSLRYQYLERVVLEGEEVVHQEKLLQDIGRVRNVVQDPEGYVYVAIETPGKIVKLIPVE